MRIAILGTGPAGLFTAWAARNHEVTLLDRDVSFKPERIFALQYLHAHCDLPVAARRELELHYRIEPQIMQYWSYKTRHLGLDPDLVRAAYNRKLGRPEEDVNSTRFAFQHPKVVFSLKHAYTWLYEQFQPVMRMENIDRWGLWRLAGEYDRVISTVPLNVLYPRWPLEVTTMKIIQGYTPIALSENECVMNIDPAVAWTRTSRIDGGVATEFLNLQDIGLYDGHVLEVLRKVIKPHLYPALPENVTLAGRWGSWDPRPLTHDTYWRFAEEFAS